MVAPASKGKSGTTAGRQRAAAATNSGTPRKRRSSRKKSSPWWGKLIKIPLHFWRTSILLVLFLLGGFLSNLDRAAHYVQRLSALRSFMPSALAELVFPPEYPDFGRAAQNQVIFGTVTRVLDGDTFVLKSVGGQEYSYKIRMWGIDTPESKQEFGAEATAALTGKILNRAVKVTVKATDRYSRQVCQVFGDNDEDINLYMVKYGYAWHYMDTAPEAAHLADAEREARRFKRGLWTYPNPVPPWQYRKD